jgi:CBS domain-containing protein
MLFLSDLINRPVTDVDGNRLGKLEDVVARSQPGFARPVVEAIMVRGKVGSFAIPYWALAALFSPSVPLKYSLAETELYTVTDQDILLVRDVLDKQIIDTDGARVVRVNDLELVRASDKVVVSNVDVGLRGILRRAGLSSVLGSLAKGMGRKLPKTGIAWDNVELLDYDKPMRLKVPREKLSELHPADIAEIISDLNRAESGHLLEELNVEQQADILEEVEPEFQAELVEGMENEKIADLLEEMEPDEAADLLAKLPEERSRDLLALMEADEAEDVRKLLAFPDDSAGGIMTTGYAAVLPEMTAAQVLEELRRMGDEAETIFYIYVIDREGKMVGVSSLKAVVFAQPDQPISELMQRRVVSVHLLDSQDEVAQAIAKYDLIAIPVIDDRNVLHGIVTADDALDKIIPTAWKKRLPRFYR